MFTGIIETLGRISRLERDQTNLHLWVNTPLAKELKIDQSVAHNGVCLTVVSCSDSEYQVTAIDETLQKTSMNHWQVGDAVNLERAMVVGSRLDGHMVQGHVDQTATCTSIRDQGGSWLFSFTYDTSAGHVTVAKGSITVDGTSLTVVDSEPGRFSVAIIPYTYEHTRFQHYQVGETVNLEFDVIGKYVQRYFNAING
ncbi:MAG TPA: riboflavin synthase [Flavobacteriaceae bacterium]|jgi:riboflavin synthase|nr:riboflavin synthase [Flavobacteriaceae bacterium]